MKNLTQKDLRQIKKHGLSPEKVLQNLNAFRSGIPFVELTAPATLENGIRKLSEKARASYAEKHENSEASVVKFVPASGAATRMFKDLLFFWENSKGKNLEKMLSRPEHRSVREFSEKLEAFPFYETLLAETEKNTPHFDQLSECEKIPVFLETLLSKKALGFSNFPKGLVAFHQYADETRTAFEEHFVEAAAYSSKNKKGKLHFTVAEQHLEKFQNQLKTIQEKENEVEFQVAFSFQEKNTDTLAVDLQNQAFRDENHDLVFRPSGHGALLENLNQIDADIVFIKNIDNVSTENNLPLIAHYKKALAGILLELQEESFELLRKMHDLEGPLSDGSQKLSEDAKKFLREQLNIATEAKTFSEIKNLLDRPIRVCGMVKNTGAPGGGPFWVKTGAGGPSLQIVESAQIDMKNPEQKEILEKATHFNPVDLVCGVRNFEGKKFNLHEFSNPERGFISQKSKNGHALKALELPGLWNGAMEHWNTVFVEVPQETFNPVKTVMDLLKPGHLAISKATFQV